METARPNAFTSWPAQMEIMGGIGVRRAGDDAAGAAGWDPTEVWTINLEPVWLMACEAGGVSFRILRAINFDHVYRLK